MDVLYLRLSCSEQEVFSANFRSWRFLKQPDIWFRTTLTRFLSVRQQRVCISLDRCQERDLLNDNSDRGAGQYCVVTCGSFTLDVRSQLLRVPRRPVYWSLLHSLRGKDYGLPWVADCTESYSSYNVEMSRTHSSRAFSCNTSKLLRYGRSQTSSKWLSSWVWPLP